MAHLLARIIVLSAIVFYGLIGNHALAEERAFGLDGTVYLLKDDGTYVRLPTGSTEGRINFHFDAAQDMQGKKCKLRLVLTNSTDQTIRFLRHRFKAFTRRENDTVGFTFGGGLRSQSIGSGETGEAESTFDKGTCEKIVDIEPYFVWDGRDPSDLHVDGIAPFDVIKLYNYPDVGVLKITHGSH